MQTILTGFLSANLLPIGEDDEKLKLLEDAAVDLVKQIKAEPILAYRLALVGLDEMVPAEDPVHKLVGDSVTAKWQTMINKTGAAPVQVYRAVMLRALEITAADSPDVRFAITLVARNQPAGHVEGKAKEAITAMLTGFESGVVDELIETWVNPVDMSLPKLSAKVKKPQVSKDDLSLALARASGPSDKDGRALDKPNPHWPNAGQPWSFEFVGRATDAIYAAIQSGTKGYTEEMQESLRETLETWAHGLERLALRDAKAELLWIRTSQYSPSARASYRGMSTHDLVMNAVLDTSRAVSAVAPPSVEHFLRELVASLAPKRVRISTLLTAIGPKLSLTPEGQAIIADKTLAAVGRRGLLDIAVRPSDTQSFEEQAGVPANFEEAEGDLAVRLYRELQIRKLLARVP